MTRLPIDRGDDGARDAGDAPDEAMDRESHDGVENGWVPWDEHEGMLEWGPALHDRRGRAD